MGEEEKKPCRTCKKSFIPTRPWQESCTDICRTSYYNKRAPRISLNKFDNPDEVEHLLRERYGRTLSLSVLFERCISEIVGMHLSK